MRLLDLRLNASSKLRAVFGFSQPHHFEVSLSINLNSEDASETFAGIVKIIEGIRHCSDYEHCPECNWSQLMTIVRRCREEARITCQSASITISIENRVVDDLQAQEIFLEKNAPLTHSAIH